MDAYDTSAEYIRAKVLKVAEEISQQLQKTPAGEQFFFISDIVNAVENAVGDVVHVAQDAVNEAVNVTHNIVTAVENIGERAIHATEEAVNAVTAHTQQIIEVANLAAATVKIVTATPDVVALIGGLEPIEEAGKASGAGAKGGTRASAAHLIQARRAVILEQRKGLISSTEAKRTELKSKIAAVAARIGAASRSSGA